MDKSLASALYLYCNVVSFYLATYAIDYVITDAVNDISSCIELPTTRTVLYVQTSLDKALSFGIVYKEATLKEILIEGVPQSI